MGGAEASGSSRSLVVGRALQEELDATPSGSNFPFPCMNTLPSQHTGQSAHVARLSARTGWQPFLIPEQILFSDATPSQHWGPRARRSRAPSCRRQEVPSTWLQAYQVSTAWPREAKAQEREGAEPCGCRGRGLSLSTPPWSQQLFSQRRRERVFGTILCDENKSLT